MTANLLQVRKVVMAYGGLATGLTGAGLAAWATWIRTSQAASSGWISKPSTGRS